jgi:hypothetical protein
LDLKISDDRKSRRNTHGPEAHVTMKVAHEQQPTPIGDQMKPGHPIRNIVLPIALLVPLIWMMTGCLYIPFFEHRIDSGPNVRALVGPAGSDRPIRPGHVTKAHVIALLGEPRWMSGDGNALGYETDTSFASWVYPLCFFAAEPADARTYFVRLVFDPGGNLLRYDWTHVSAYVEPKGFLGGAPSGPGDAALNEINKTQPVLRLRSEREQNTDFGPPESPTR